MFFSNLYPFDLSIPSLFLPGIFFMFLNASATLPAFDSNSLLKNLSLISFIFLLLSTSCFQINKESLILALAASTILSAALSRFCCPKCPFMFSIRTTSLHLLKDYSIPSDKLANNFVRYFYLIILSFESEKALSATDLMEKFISEKALPTNRHSLINLCFSVILSHLL